jgi:hypothetical protein
VTNPPPGRRSLAEALEPITRMLLALGYQPPQLVIDAAERLVRVPELVQDMYVYQQAGAPPVTAATPEAQFPLMLRRPLPCGHTVASLIRDFGFLPIGAFLVGAALCTHTEEAEAMLERLALQGMWLDEPHGKRVLRFPPVHERLRDCPTCHERLWQDPKACPHCRAPLKPPASASAAYCSTCGKATGPGARFCKSCGKAVAVQPEANTCARCGVEVRGEARFCRACGAQLSA